jgi:hypothetical protein
MSKRESKSSPCELMIQLSSLTIFTMQYSTVKEIRKGLLHAVLVAKGGSGEKSGGTLSVGQWHVTAWMYRPRPRWLF